MNVLDSLLSRSSVSSLRAPGPDGRELDLILETGLRAPDHGQLRPWRFVLVRGAARSRLANLATAGLTARDPDALPMAIERQRNRLLGVPLIIAVGAKVRLNHKIPLIEQMLSVGAAAMNVLNAVHALGYGAIWVTGANTYDPSINTALGFTSPDRLAGFLFVGTPAADMRPASRPHLAEHVVEWAAEEALPSFGQQTV